MNCLFSPVPITQRCDEITLIDRWAGTGVLTIGFGLIIALMLYALFRAMKPASPYDPVNLLKRRRKMR